MPRLVELLGGEIMLPTIVKLKWKGFDGISFTPAPLKED
jgi:hypothetical protein